MIAELLLSSKYTVVLTGAGMSTESGIPDFRSKGTGLWNSDEFLRFAYPEAIRDNPEGFTKFYKTGISNIENFKPNTGHEILAKWEQEGLVKTIITQNIDEFHQGAGSKKVIEIHGSMKRLHCNSCGRRVSSDEYILKSKIACECGGFIRPSIVLFSEQVNDLELSMEEAEKADLFLVLGTSLTVYPAAELPRVAKANGAKLVIINREETDLDCFADVVVNERGLGEVLLEIDEELEKIKSSGN